MVDDAANTVGFTRSYEGRTLFIALNRSESEQALDLDLEAAGSTLLYTTDATPEISWAEGGGPSTLVLPALTGAVWELLP